MVLPGTNAQRWQRPKCWLKRELLMSFWPTTSLGPILIVLLPIENATQQFAFPSPQMILDPLRRFPDAWRKKI